MFVELIHFGHWSSALVGQTPACPPIFNPLCGPTTPFQWTPLAPSPTPSPTHGAIHLLWQYFPYIVIGIFVSGGSVATYLKKKAAPVRERAKRLRAAYEREARERAQQRGVFICYRQADTAWTADALENRLRTALEGSAIFRDVDSVPLGRPWAREVETRLSDCMALIALIGPMWLGATDEGGRLRLWDPGDLVRLEIKMALEREILVIPVLVDGAQLPAQGDLPADIAGLRANQYLELRSRSSPQDIDRLIKTLKDRIR